MGQITRALAAVVSVCVLSVTSGCSQLIPMLVPTRPLSRGYVEPGSALVLRNACGAQFASVRVTQLANKEAGPYWEAVAGTPQDSVGLFADAVDGYRVDSSGELNLAEPVLIAYQEASGSYGSLVATPASLGSGQVAFDGGVESSSDFQRRSAADFGCRHR
jgi:hypothetical protein